MTVGDRTYVVVVRMEVEEFEIVPFDLLVVVAHYAVEELSLAEVSVSVVVVAVVDIATSAAAEWWAVLLFGEQSSPSDPYSAADWDCLVALAPVLAFAVV